MNIVATGHDQVRRLEQALGGSPPREAFEEVRAALQRRVTERVERERARRAEWAQLQERQSKLLFGHLTPDDAQLRQLNEERRASIDQRSKSLFTAPAPPVTKQLPRMDLELTLKVPPYDYQLVSADPGAGANSDASTGYFKLAVQSIGNGGFHASSYVGSSFYSSEATLHQIVVPLYYNNDWWCQGGIFYTAHANLTTQLHVYGLREGEILASNDLDPKVHDGETAYWNGNDPNPNWSGTPLTGVFQTLAQSWYIVAIVNTAEADSNSGFFGFADATIWFQAYVQAMIWQSL
jgi:hypothetical protein